MLTRQGNADIDDAALKRVLDAFLAEDVSPEFADLVAENIASLRAPPEISTMTTKEFSLKEAVIAFGLKFNDRVPGQVGSPKWCIQDIPETKRFVISPCLSKSVKRSRSNVDPYLMVWLV